MDNKAEQAEIRITWLNTRPVKYWFNNKLVWSADRDALDDIDTPHSISVTVFVLNLIEAVRFSVIFINGLSAANITALLTKANTKLATLNVFKDIMLLDADFACGDCEACEDKYNCPAYQGAEVDEGVGVDEDEDEDNAEWDDELDDNESCEQAC